MTDLDQFKQCPKCHEWFSINDIIGNPLIKPIGMEICTFDPELSLYCFSHNTPECRTTFVIPVGEMQSYIVKHIPIKLRAGSAKCEKHCDDLIDMTLCHQNCRNAPFRELLIIMIKNRKITAGMNI